MNKKLLLGLLLVLLLIPCIALADTCDICGDAPTAWKGEAVFATELSHIKTCEHGVEYTFNHSYDNVKHHNNGNTHWEICEECGHQGYVSRHSVKCTGDRSVCQYCGAPCNADNSFVVHNESSNYSYNDTKHYLLCSDCGEQSEEAWHVADCRTPNICMQCKYENCSDAMIDHSYDYLQFETDETYHWNPCKVCGARANEEEHGTYCNKPGKCVCGIDYTGSNLYHYWDFDTGIRSDETSHWVPCKNCDARVNESIHYRYCNGSTCIECGSDYNGDRFFHNVDENTWKHNDTQHWNECSNCQTAFNKDEHRRMCGTFVCNLCDAPYTGNNVDNHNREWKYNDTYHWNECTICHETWNYNEEHRRMCGTSICYRCNAPYTGNNIDNHDLDLNVWKSDSTGHWNECNNCHETWNKTAHTVLCSSPNKCTICGSTCSGSDITHSFNEGDYESDGVYHWRKCTNCSYTIDKAEHFAHCETPNKCAVCACSYSGNNLIHEIDKEHWASDATYHWHKCAICSQRIDDKEAHHSDCDTNGTCNICGTTFIDPDPGHYFWNDQYEWDENYHWNPCSKCDGYVNKSRHYALCTNPGICAECKQPYSGSEIRHEGLDWDNYVFDENHHWLACANCDVHYNELSHIAVCSAPGKCRTCGANFSGDTRGHNFTGKTDHDDTYHWAVCDFCGALGKKVAHFANCQTLGVCGGCGISYTGNNIIHSATYYRYDDTKHWSICIDCGSKCYEGEHEASCKDDSMCVKCKYPVTGGTLHHFSDWNIWEFDKTYHWQICNVCSDVFNKEAHDTKIKSQQNATCTVAGSTTYGCDLCNKTWSETIPATGNHSEVIDSRTPATCLVDGSITYKCSSCGQSRTETIPAAGSHSEVIDSQTPATCLVDGSITYKCSVCGESRIETIPAAGSHSEVIDNQTPATCLVDGSITYKCSVCGESRTEVIKAVGKHEEVVDRGRQATCTEIGYTDGTHCGVCDEVLVARQTIPMLEHDWQQGEVTAATCTTDGKTMFACSACEATKEEAIPATGHQFGAYRSLNNGTHAAECENGCGETRVRDCDYENVASGLFTYSTCKVCAYTKYSVLPTKEPEASVEPAATPAPNGEATADTDAPTQPESSETPAQPEATEAPASTLEPEVETALVKLVEEIAAAPETVEIKQVENAAIAPVPAANDETEEAPTAVIPENAQLIVHEQALPQESTSLPGARLFHIALSVDGYAVEHTGTVQIELPAPEVIDHTVMRLVLLQPDGSMIEIPYEIIDGKLVFHTDLPGVFALVPVAAI